MKQFEIALAIAVSVACGCGRSQAPLSPTHIEVPDYDRVARTAHIQGQVVVNATIDSNGRVTGVRSSGPPILARFAEKNIQLWTFEKPRHAPLEQAVIYNFVIEY